MTLTGDLNQPYVKSSSPQSGSDLHQVQSDYRRHAEPILMLHIALHFLLPAIITSLFFRQRWQTAYFWLVATMLVDIDHLLAVPIYDPNRCSIGFHPLHQPWFIALYFLLCFMPKTRLIGLGLIIHMTLDAIDCQLMTA